MNNSGAIGFGGAVTAVAIFISLFSFVSPSCSQEDPRCQDTFNEMKSLSQLLEDERSLARRIGSGEETLPDAGALKKPDLLGKLRRDRLADRGLILGAGRAKVDPKIAAREDVEVMVMALEQILERLREIGEDCHFLRMKDWPKVSQAIATARTELVAERKRDLTVRAKFKRDSIKNRSTRIEHEPIATIVENQPVRSLDSDETDLGLLEHVLTVDPLEIDEDIKNETLERIYTELAADWIVFLGDTVDVKYWFREIREGRSEEGVPVGGRLVGGAVDERDVVEFVLFVAHECNPVICVARVAPLTVEAELRASDELGRPEQLIYIDASGVPRRSLDEASLQKHIQEISEALHVGQFEIPRAKLTERIKSELSRRGWKVSRANTARMQAIQIESSR